MNLKNCEIEFLQITSARHYLVFVFPQIDSVFSIQIRCCLTSRKAAVSLFRKIEWIAIIACTHCCTTDRSPLPCRLLLVWEERAALAKLKEKVINEGGRAILRIEEEEWKVVLIG